MRSISRPAGVVGDDRRRAARATQARRSACRSWLPRSGWSGQSGLVPDQATAALTRPAPPGATPNDTYTDARPATTASTGERHPGSCSDDAGTVAWPRLPTSTEIRALRSQVPRQSRKPLALLEQLGLRLPASSSTARSVQLGAVGGDPGAACCARPTSRPVDGRRRCATSCGSSSEQHAIEVVTRRPGRGRSPRSSDVGAEACCSRRRPRISSASTVSRIAGRSGDPGGARSARSARSRSSRHRLADSSAWSGTRHARNDEQTPPGTGCGQLVAR